LAALSPGVNADHRGVKRLAEQGARVRSRRPSEFKAFGNSSVCTWIDNADKAGIALGGGWGSRPVLAAASFQEIRKSASISFGLIASVCDLVSRKRRRADGVRRN
jgi:hypothetical protein